MVERVQGDEQEWQTEKRVLDRRLPGETEVALPPGDPPGVIEGERPVGTKGEPGRFVDADGGQHDRELDERVAAGERPFHDRSVVA